MVSGDVFRAPTNSLALCVQTGSGVQIITSGFITLFFAALGDSSRSGNMGCPSLLSQVPCIALMPHILVCLSSKFTDPVSWLMLVLKLSPNHLKTSFVALGFPALAQSQC